MPQVAALPLCVVLTAAVRARGEGVWARPVVVPASCAVPMAAVRPRGEFADRNGAPVVPSCGGLVAELSFAGAS